MLAGCSGDVQQGGKLAPVKGKVTIKGAPAKGVQINLYPTGGSKSPMASGNCKDDGTYVISNADGREGAAPGKYKVVLVQITGGGAGGNTAYTGGAAAPKNPNVRPGMPDPTFPDEWLTADTSPKEVEIKSGDNTVNVDIP